MLVTQSKSHEDYNVSVTLLYNSSSGFWAGNRQKQMQSRSPRDLFLILVFIDFSKIFIRVDRQQIEAIEILGKC